MRWRKGWGRHCHPRAGGDPGRNQANALAAKGRRAFGRKATQKVDEKARRESGFFRRFNQDHQPSLSPPKRVPSCDTPGGKLSRSLGKESTRIEYKQQVDLTGNRDRLAVEMASDIVQFANSFGGELLIGIRENKAAGTYEVIGCGN